MKTKLKTKLLIGTIIASGLLSQMSNFSVIHADGEKYVTGHTSETTANKVLPRTYNSIKTAIETNNPALLKYRTQNISISDLCSLKFKAFDYDPTEFDMLSFAIIHGSIDVVDFLLYQNSQLAQKLSLKTASVRMFIKEVLHPVRGNSAVCMDMFYDYMEEHGYEVRSNCFALRED